MGSGGLKTGRTPRNGAGKTYRTDEARDLVLFCELLQGPRPFAERGSGDPVFHEFSGDVGQSEVTALEAVGELEVIETKQVQ